MNTGKYWAMEILFTFFNKHIEMWLLQKLNENTILLPMDLSHSLGEINFLFTENKFVSGSTITILVTIHSNMHRNKTA